MALNFCWQLYSLKKKQLKKIFFLKDIGTTIKDKFDGATEVAIVSMENKPKIERKNSMFKRHTPADLVGLINMIYMH